MCTLMRLTHGTFEDVVEMILLCFCGRSNYRIGSLATADGFLHFLRDRLSGQWKPAFLAFLEKNRVSWKIFPITSARFAAYLERCSVPTLADGIEYKLSCADESALDLPSAEVCKLEDIPQIQTMILTQSYRETLQVVLDTFFSESRPVSPLALQFILEDMSPYSCGYTEISRLFRGLDAIEYWDKNVDAFCTFGYLHVLDQVDVFLPQIVPVPYKIVEKDFVCRQSEFSHVNALLELAYCLEFVGVPFDIAPLICRPVFLLATASFLPLTLPVACEAGAFHFGESPFTECVGSLTIPCDGTVHVIQQSPFYSGRYIDMRIPYALLRKAWYASLCGPTTEFGGSKLFRSLRPHILSHGLYSAVVRFDVSVISKGCSVWISCFDEDLILCGGSTLSPGRATCDVGMCMPNAVMIPGAPHLAMSLLQVDARFFHDSNGIVYYRAHALKKSAADGEADTAILCGFAYNALPAVIYEPCVELSADRINKPEVRVTMPYVTAGFHEKLLEWKDRRKGRHVSMIPAKSTLRHRFIMGEQEVAEHVGLKFRNMLVKVTMYVAGMVTLSLEDICQHYDTELPSYYDEVEQFEISKLSCRCVRCVRAALGDESESEDDDDEMVDEGRIELNITENEDGVVVCDSMDVDL